MSGACTCACTSGGFCGGCGHAGCGGRQARRTPVSPVVPTIVPKSVLPDDGNEQVRRVLGVLKELERLRAEKERMADCLSNLRFSRGGQEAQIAAAVFAQCRDVVARLVPPGVEVPGTKLYPCFYCGTGTPVGEANCSPWFVVEFGWVVACKLCGGDDEGGPR